MATITVKYTKSIQKEIEVSFPLFKSHGSAVYKILSEKDWIEVTAYNEKQKGIEVTEVGFCYSHLVLCEGKDITEEEFDGKFKEAFAAISKALNTKEAQDA